jgi:hypothetical protein
VIQNLSGFTIEIAMTISLDSKSQDRKQQMSRQEGCGGRWKTLCHRARNPLRPRSRKCAISSSTDDLDDLVVARAARCLPGIALFWWVIGISWDERGRYPANCILVLQEGVVILEDCRPISDRVAWDPGHRGARRRTD